MRGSLPAKGWVLPDEVVYCDVCGRRVWVWELHHLIPIAWGGNDSRHLTDHQVVWVRTDGDCHATIHMILDTAKKAGAWPEAWLVQTQIPHLIVETARRGWNAYVKETPT